MVDNPYGIAALWTQSDWVIKGVAVILVLMSLASWQVIISKIILLRKLRSLNNAVIPRSGLAKKWLEQLQQEAKVAKDFYQLCDAQQTQSLPPLQAWLQVQLKNKVSCFRGTLQADLAILASISSSAPFIGLFGTVWGIYHALVKISLSGSAGIDKVAGPVGEALVMTAFGLAVAIPALIFYNVINRANAGKLDALVKCALEVEVEEVFGHQYQPSSH
ncbi:MotA/TolQ/ExbB proton channel family protein [Pseudoalteromonas piscicida]|uniref:MotA/TolQ/ExbB proton channel family protein n=1 Tax=Pseudoalteromonas piscicida TaxID=43662 RepID=UPI0030A32EAD